MKRFGILAAAAASLFCLAPSQADACPELLTEIDTLIANQTSTGNGASFIERAMYEGWGYTYDEYNYMWDVDFPSSPVLYDAIVANDYFNNITNVANIAPGQLVVIDTSGTPGLSDYYAGHAMMVVAAPQKLTIPLKPYVTGTNQYALKIADATGSVHGSNVNWPDSRSGTTNKNGTGYIRIYADATTGSIVGQPYTWSVTSSTTAPIGPSTRGYAIGEFTACDPLGYP